AAARRAMSAGPDRPGLPPRGKLCPPSPWRACGGEAAVAPARMRWSPARPALGAGFPGRGGQPAPFGRVAPRGGAIGAVWQFYAVLLEALPDQLENVGADVSEAFFRIVDPKAHLESDAVFTELGDPRRWLLGAQHARTIEDRLEHELFGQLHVRIV